MKKLKKYMIEKKIGISALYVLAAFEVQAALPTATPPSTGAGAGNWLKLIEGYFKDAGLVVGLGIAVAAFLWISWITVSKFNDARKGQAEWGEVGLTAIVAAGVMVFISFLLTEASTTIA